MEESVDEIRYNNDGTAVSERFVQNRLTRKDILDARGQVAERTNYGANGEVESRIEFRRRLDLDIGYENLDVLISGFCRSV